MSPALQADSLPTELSGKPVAKIIPPLKPFNESGLQCNIPEIVRPLTTLILRPAHRRFLVRLFINVEFERWSKKSGDNFLTEKTPVDHVPWSLTCGPWTQTGAF